MAQAKRRTGEIKREVDELGIEAPPISPPEQASQMVVDDGKRKHVDNTLKSTEGAIDGFVANARNSLNRVPWARLGAGLSNLKPGAKTRWTPALRPVG